MSTMTTEVLMPRKKAPTAAQAPPVSAPAKKPWNPDEVVKVQILAKRGRRRTAHAYAIGQGQTISELYDVALVEYLTKRGVKL
jgi:pyruvate/2-oxoglutarate dehydrogenase complex dihydrolipoamide acyltransferase (E2) component